MQVQAYRGDEYFNKILKDLGIDMNAYEVKMYMLGYFLSPEPISPMMPLEEILLKDTDSEIEFKTDKEAEEFHMSYLGLWNKLVGYEGSSRFPELSKPQENFKDREEKINYILNKGEELLNLYMGLDESGASEYFDQCFDLTMAQLGLSMMGDLFNNFALLSLDNEVTDEDIEDMLAVANDFHESWPTAFRKIYDLFLQIRRGNISLDSEEEMEAKLEALKSKSLN